MSTINWFFSHIEKISTYTLQHFILICIAIILSLIIWVFTGIVIRKNENIANGVLGIASIIMSVPSIALYGILVSIPGLGLSRTSAVLGLILYAMLPIVRNVYVALNQVDPSILEAAKGMGMPSRKILYKIQLPLALPIILVGVRVSLVMMVGIATLAVYIGEMNLGRLIQQGIARTHIDMIIVGAVLVSIIAIIVDIIMGKLQNIIISPGLKEEIESANPKKG